MGGTASPAAVLVVLVSMAGCSGMAPPEPSSHTAPGANLAAYTTFGWQTGAGNAAGDEPMRMLDTNIRSAIRVELTRRGYAEADHDPQLLVTYETTAREKVKSSPFRIGIGVGSFGSNVGGSVNVSTSSVESYQEGHLTIHVLDAAENQELWFGTLSGKVDTANLGEAAVAQAVARTMQNFPARAATPSPP